MDFRLPSIPSRVDQWTELRGGTLDLQTIPRPRIGSPSPVERLVRRRAAGVWRTSVLTLVVASLAGFVTYSIAKGSGTLDGPELWRWLTRSQDGWDPMATLAVIAGVVLPLFLATQVGDVTRARSSTTHSARAVGLETVTSTACLCGAVLSWLTVPAVLAGNGVAPVNMLVALATPVLFSALFAISAPSEDSERLAQVRSDVLRAEIQRLVASFDAALAGPDGIPGRRRSRKELLGPLVRDAVVHGALVGAVFAALTWHGRERFVVDAATTGVLLTLAYLGALAARIDRDVTSMLDGRLSATALRWLHSCFWLFLTSITLGLLATGHWRVTLVLWVACVGAVILARRRHRARAFQALVYRSFRSRAANYVRAERRKKDQRHLEDLNTPGPGTPAG